MSLRGRSSKRIKEIRAGSRKNRSHGLLIITERRITRIGLRFTHHKCGVEGRHSQWCSEDVRIPVFFGIGSLDSRHLQRIQNRCLRMVDLPSSIAEDLSSRRKRFALRLVSTIPSQTTLIRTFLPSPLPSGRFSVPFCRTSLRRNSFIPAVSILISSSHCD